MVHPLLQVENLTVTFRSGQRAVDQVSFVLYPGTATGLIGESGCGKTTLLQSIFGYTQDATLSGAVYFNGINILRLPLGERRRLWWREISIVFANTQRVLNPVLTVGEQIREVLRTSKQDLKSVGQLFSSVGLDPSHINSFPHQLSGGMRQKVLIAMALGANPKLLLIDEPTSSIDPLSRGQIRDLLIRLQQKLGLTCFVASHDLPLIEGMTQKTLIMCQGTIVELAGTKEILDKPNHPYTKGLINSSPQYYPYKELWGMKPQDAKGNHAGCPFYSRCTQREKVCASARPLLLEQGGRQIACHLGGITTLLRAQDICKSFNKQRALSEVDMEISHGEVVALLGETGSGKSTLAQVLAGILTPDAGLVSFLGRRIQGHWATSMQGAIQIVFQDPIAALNERFSVFAAVEEPLLLLGLPVPTRQELVKTAVEQLGLGDNLLERKCRELSSGQLQRVAIARALVMEPKLLIADEISSFLDPSSQANLLRLLKELQYQKGFSMLFITHDAALARKIADTICIIERGRILEKGPARTVLANPKHQYTRLLLGG